MHAELPGLQAPARQVEGGEPPAQDLDGNAQVDEGAEGHVTGEPGDPVDVDPAAHQEAPAPPAPSYRGM